MIFGVRKLVSRGYRVALFAWSTFSRFDTIPEFDRHTHTQTNRQRDTRRRHILHLA